MTKFFLLLILSLLIVNIKSVAITDSSACAANDDINVVITATASTLATWDAIIDCIAAIGGQADDAIDSLTINIAIAVQSAQTKPLAEFNAKFKDGVTIDISIANSGLTSADLSTNLYTPLGTITHGGVKVISDVLPLVADVTTIGTLIAATKFNALSSIQIGASPCTIASQAALDACLDTAFTLNKAAVTACDDTIGIYKELSLTSDSPAEVNTCLGKIDTIGANARLQKLTIDYTGVTTVGDDHVNFASMFATIKTAITDINVNLKSSNYKSAPLVGGFSELLNLTLNYSNNGIDASTIGALVTGLKTAGSVAQTTFTVTLSDSADDSNTFGNLKNLIPITEATATTKSFNVYDRDDTCTFSTSDINDSCSIIVITPTLSDDSLLKCDDHKVNISSNLATAENLNEGESLVTTTPSWTATPSTTGWTLTATETINDLVTKEVPAGDFQLSYSAATYKIGNKNVPVIIEDVDFTVGACQAETTITVDGNAAVASYNNCSDLQFGIGSIQANGQTSDDSTVTTNTVYTWVLKRGGSAIAIADTNNDGTLDVTKAELTAGSYTLALTTTTPSLYADEISFTVGECPAIPYINAAAAKASYTDCQDLVLSVGEWPTGMQHVEGTTVYAWTVMKGTDNVLAGTTPIPNDTKTITIPKASLEVATYDVTLTITGTPAPVDNFSVQITDGGECGKKKEPTTTDSSSLLQLSLALVLVLAALL